jgi:hypothetical protein
MRSARPHQTLLPPSTARRTTRKTPWRRALVARLRKLSRQHPALLQLLQRILALCAFALVVYKVATTMFDDADVHALLLSLGAGLATSVGGRALYNGFVSSPS